MNDAIELLQEVDRILDLGNSGYAKITEVDEAEASLQAFLKANIDTETLFGRKFDKWNSGTRWKAKYHGKYANNSHLHALKSLRGFLVEFVEQSDVEIPTNQQFIKPGAVYTGSRILREVLSGATEGIDIQDNFVGVRLLDILEQILEESSGLEVRLLTKNGNYKDLKPFIKNLPLFQKQFPKLRVKSHDQAHGRFFIIDGTLVFTPGASLKDIGKKADLFSEVTDVRARQEMIENFESWWDVGQVGVEVK